MRSRTLPFWIGGFPAAEQERRLSCRRLGGQGGRSPHFTLSPLYTSRPPNRLTTRKSRRQESRLSQWATRKSPLPAGRSQWATRKSPLPAGGKKAACPSGRQESRPSQQAARKPPVPMGDKKDPCVAPPSRRQESRLSQFPLGDKKVAPPAALPRSPPSRQMGCRCW